MRVNLQKHLSSSDRLQEEASLAFCPNGYNDKTNEHLDTNILLKRYVGAMLAGANLREAKLMQSDLGGANFYGSGLTHLAH